MDKNLNKYKKWNIKKYNFVLYEFKLIYKTSIETDTDIFDVINANNGDFRRYYLKDHYYKFRKNFKWFIDYEEYIRMELDRIFLPNIPASELDKIYLVIINQSYLYNN